MSKKNIAAIVFLLALSAVCMSLGKWQLSRAAERVALTEEITAGRNQPLIDLNSAPGNTHNWQPSRATGYWRPDLTVLLENRNYQGRPGYWVATPLILDSDDNEAVLVLRGWLARTTSQPVLPPLQAEEAVSIQGELRSHVPRMYELMRLWGPEAESLPSTLSSAGGRIPTVQNLQTADLERVSNLRLRPYVLLQQQVSPPSENPSLIQDWPQPNLDAHQNRGYAIQWFSFATIAGAAAILLLWRSRRSKMISRDTDA